MAHSSIYIKIINVEYVNFIHHKEISSKQKLVIVYLKYVKIAKAYFISKSERYLDKEVLE